MQWFWFENDAVVTVSYEVDGSPVVPNHAKAVLRDALGVVLWAPPLSLGVTDELVTIPAEYLGRTGDRDTEARFLEVTFDGHRLTIPFMLSDYVPLTATPQMVRSLLGAEPNELPDVEIDLMTAYMNLRHRLPSSLGIKENLAIAIQAALALATSFELRFHQTRRSEDATATRQRIDFDALRADLTGRLGLILDEIDPPLATTTRLFVLSNPTDIITNA